MVGIVQQQTKGYDALASQWDIENTMYQQQEQQWKNRDRTVWKAKSIAPEDWLCAGEAWTKFQP